MTYLLFADDLVLFSNSASGLQKQIDGLRKYASLWHLIVSLPTIKIPIFFEKYVKPFGSFYYGEDIIKKVNEYKYLGVIFNTDSKHCLQKTYSHLSTQATKAIFAVRKQSLPVVGPLSPLIAFKIFDSQILLILEYGSEIWYTGHDISEMEK